MDIHTKFNVGDKVYLLYSHGTGGTNKPFYIQTEIFKDKQKNDLFTISEIRVKKGKDYCLIDYRFYDWNEIFIPSESKMCSSKKEAIQICKNNNLESCQMYYSLDKVLINKGRTKEENQRYIDEIERLKKEICVLNV